MPVGCAACEAERPIFLSRGRTERKKPPTVTSITQHAILHPVGRADRTEVTIRPTITISIGTKVNNLG